MVALANGILAEINLTSMHNFDLRPATWGDIWKLKSAQTLSYIYLRLAVFSEWSKSKIFVPSSNLPSPVARLSLRFLDFHCVFFSFLPCSFEVFVKY
jgi:hypothetical protein